MTKFQWIRTCVFLIIATATLNISMGCSSASAGSSPDGEPWKPEQLMDPAALAKRLETGKDVPVIINIGPSGLIAGALDIGPGQDEANIANMKKELAKLTKDREVVIYCGCCPFKNCPNIRPAFTALNEAGMKKSYLLNLPQNLRVDWIAKDYPMAKN